MSDSGLAGFEIIEKIGSQGAGTVYRARQLSLDRTVAFHILPPGVAKSREDIERFKSEARSVASLKHPGIVQVHEAGEHEGLFFFATELVDGATLDDRLYEESTVPIPTALTIATEIADALNHAWSRAQISHRRLCPGCILLDEGGSVKLEDLGVADLGGSSESENVDYYSSPDLARGAEVDCRTDMYSLGAILYHMLCGTMPFEDVEPGDVRPMQVNGHITNPKELNPEITKGLSDVIRKLMAKDPAQNYADWSDVIADLKRVSERKKPAKLLSADAESTVKPYDASAAAQAEGTGSRIRISTGAGRKRGRSRRRSVPNVSIRGKSAPASKGGEGSPKIQIHKKSPSKISASSSPKVQIHKKPSTPKEESASPKFQVHKKASKAKEVQAAPKIQIHKKTSKKKETATEVGVAHETTPQETDTDEPTRFKVSKNKSTGPAAPKVKFGKKHEESDDAAAEANVSVKTKRSATSKTGSATTRAVSRRKRRTNRAPAASPALLITVGVGVLLLVVSLVLMNKARNRSRGAAIIEQREADAFFSKKLKSALRFNRNRGSAYQEAIQELEKLALEAKGTPISRKASEAASDLRRQKESGILNTIAQLKTEAEELSSTDPNEAISVYEDYDGTWVEETAAERAKLAEALSAQRNTAASIEIQKEYEREMSKGFEASLLEDIASKKAEEKPQLSEEEDDDIIDLY